MKNIKFLFLLVATLFATAFTACQQEWEPGKADSELCVYFPVDVDVAPFGKKDDTSTDHDERKIAAFPVYRQGESGEMTVEIRSRFLEPDKIACREYNEEGTEIVKEYTVAELFTIAESVTFQDGFKEAYLYITLNTDIDNLSVGNMFDAEILVKDVKHQGHYGLSRKTFSIGIPETWKNLGDEQKDPELKLGTYTEDFFVMLYGVDAGNRIDIAIEESEARAGVYRVKNLFSQENIVTLLGGVPSDMSFATGDTYIIINASDPKSVYIPYQYTGIGIPGYMDQFWIASGKAIGAEGGKLENGYITFPANTVGLLSADGAGMYTNPTGKMRFTLPGVSMKDYSFSVAYNGTETSADNTETRAMFEFNVGADIKKYRFVVVEGNETAYAAVGTSAKQHDAIAAMLKAEYTDGVPSMEGFDEAAQAYLENSAESDASSTTWYISMPKAGIYTLFAVPYDAAGNAIKGDNGLETVIKTYFYYHPANQDNVDVNTDLCEPNLYLTSVAELMGEEYESSYPACFYLAFDVQTDDADYVSQLTWYYAKSKDVPAGATDEELIAKAGADGDISYQISGLKKGGNPLLISAKPDTEYTVVLAITSIYGKTTYHRIEGKTAPYSFGMNYGTYEFVNGDAKMTIDIDPFYSADEFRSTGCGEMFYLTWIVEEGALDENAGKYPMVAFMMPEDNAIVCYGQVNGYYGSVFAKDLGSYTYNEEVAANEVLLDEDGEPVKDDTNQPIKVTKKVINGVWGFHNTSSSFDYAMHYDSEALVLYYDENGTINRIGTDFRKYFKKTRTLTVVKNVKDESGKVTPTTEEIEEVLEPEYIMFPANETVINKVEKPVVDENVSDDTNDSTDNENGAETEGDVEGDDTVADESTEDKTASAKIGVCKSSKPAQLQMKKDLSFEALNIK